MVDTQLVNPPASSTASLIPQAAIEALARQIAARFDPERIYLFGSYAYRTPTPDSDVDILVVMEATDIDEQRKQIVQQVPFDYYLGIIVYTPACFAERLVQGDVLHHDVYERGKVLYDSGRVIIAQALAKPLPEEALTVEVGSVKLKTLAVEWLDKAESDFWVLDRLRPISKDHLCYYSRQCAERYLKAFLQEHDTYFAKTYDLLELLALCLPLDGDLESQHEALARLNQYSENILYPGRCATTAEAKLAP
ncbi:MAG: hypothetical protein DLM69_02810, partial [Candidatus Chloroheliales bacterium]